MTNTKFSLTVALATGALTLGSPAPPAWAQNAADMAAIRQMVEQMKQDYETKIRDLERRLEKTESDAQSAKESAAQTKAAVAARPPAVATAAAAVGGCAAARVLACAALSFATWASPSVFSRRRSRSRILVS